MTGAWLPAEEYVKTIPHATVWGDFFMTDERGKILQLRSSIPDYPKPWQFPGGNLEHGQTPWQTAVREALEETGLVVSAEPRLLAVQFVLPSARWPLAKVGFVFDGGILSDRQLAGIRLDPDEHSSWEVQFLENWRARVGPRQWRRLTATAQARATGVTAYLSDADGGPGAGSPAG